MFKCGQAFVIALKKYTYRAQAQTDLIHAPSHSFSLLQKHTTQSPGTYGLEPSLSMGREHDVVFPLTSMVRGMTARVPVSIPTPLSRARSEEVSSFDGSSDQKGGGSIEQRGDSSLEQKKSSSLEQKESSSTEQEKGSRKLEQQKEDSSKKEGPSLPFVQLLRVEHFECEGECEGCCAF